MSNQIEISGNVTTEFLARAYLIGTSVVTLDDVPPKLTRGVQILTDSGNAGVVYVSHTNGVTTTSNVETDGFPLSSDKGLFIPIDKLSKVHLIASQAAQKIYIFAV